MRPCPRLFSDLIECLGVSAFHLLACAPTSGIMDAGVVGAPEQCDDGTEVVSSVDHPTSLELESERDVTPVDAEVARPDAIAVNDQVWLAYSIIGVGFQLQRFDAQLNPIGEAQALEHAAEMPTDIRVGLANDQFWYAYETVQVPSVDCEHNFLGVAAYSADSPPVLAHSTRHIATGCPTTPEFIQSHPGLPEAPEAVDDPTPFCHGSARYVLTRAWPEADGAPHHLRRLDSDLALVEHVLLDSAPLLPGTSLQPNTLLHLGGRPYLVGGFTSGPPLPPFASHLCAIQLSDDLRSFRGQPIPLDVPDATYAQRVTRALHVNGTLIINYTDRYRDQPTRELIALFDAAAPHAFISQVQVQDHDVVDNHSSFAIMGSRLYLFQQQDGARISAKIFQLRS